MPSALSHKVTDFHAFVGHHVSPNLLTGTLSSHVGGGGHGVAASHFFLHFFFFFLHAFFVSVHSIYLSIYLYLSIYHSSKATPQSSLHVSTFTELLHGGGAGDGGDATATGDAGEGGGGDATATGDAGEGGIVRVPRSGTSITYPSKKLFYETQLPRTGSAKVVEHRLESMFSLFILATLYDL